MCIYSYTEGLCVLRRACVILHAKKHSTNGSTKGAHRGLHPSNEQNSARCGLCAFAFIKMQSGVFLPKCTKYRGEKMQIHKLSTGIMIYQA